MADFQYDVIVIGAGPGGIEAAKQAGFLGLRTAIVSGSRIGGRATWNSLVPSKVWLATAEKMDIFRQIEDFGIKSNGMIFDIETLRSRVQEQSQTASQLYINQLEKTNVKIYLGLGMLLDAYTVEVEMEDGTKEKISASNIIAATGSGPRFLTGIKPNRDQIIAPRLVPGLEKLPESMIVAGGGVTGTEYAYAFAALGARVTILHNAGQLLPRMDEEVSQAFEDYLTRQYGIAIYKNDAVASIQQNGRKVIAFTRSGKEFDAEYGFIAIGRTPDLDFFRTESLPLQLTEEGAVVINEFCQTNFPNIYAVGDVTGLPMVANRAILQARVAVQHLREGPSSDLKLHPFIEAAYTHPPMGQIGDMAPSAEAIFITKQYNELLKSHLTRELNGMLKIKIDWHSGKIRGAAGYGKHITEILAVIQVAIRNELAYQDIHRVPFAHPSLSEILSMMDLI